MSDSLKDKNVKMVAALVGVSVLAAWAVSAGVGGALELRKVLLELGAAAAYTAIVTWLSTLLPADWKPIQISSTSRDWQREHPPRPPEADRRVVYL